MSKNLLNNIVKELRTQLDSDIKKLRSELNYEENITIISKTIVIKSILTELNFVEESTGEIIHPGWLLLEEEQKRHILELIQVKIDEVMEKIFNNAKKAETAAAGIYVTVFPETYTRDDDIEIHAFYPVGEAPSYSHIGVYQSNNFIVIREIYRQEVNQIIDEISRLASSANDNLDKIKSSRTQALTHDKGSAIAEHKASRADLTFQKLLKKGKTDKGRDLSPKARNNLIKDWGFEIFMTYTSALDATKAHLTIGSFIENQSQGLGPEADLIRDRKKVLKAAEDRIKKNDWGNWGGSDSRKTIEKKKIIKYYEQGVMLSEVAKIVTTSNTKINLSKGTKSKKERISGEKKSRRSVASFKGSAKKQAIRKSSANSTIALAALVNQKLTQTVKENMGPPSLANRTGRFAESVRVTDVLETKGGFPSIGYTYRKNPYQVFEDGAGMPPWSNGKRDPRKLIDRSIREIAAQLITGRFYTRRM